MTIENSAFKQMKVDKRIAAINTTVEADCIFWPIDI